MVRKKQALNGSAPVDDARRNWFAGLAMQALVPDEASKHALQIDEIDVELVARAAYKIADAMEAEASRSLEPESESSLMPSPESESQAPNSVSLPPPRLPEGVFDPRPK
jgi:hypothetical protein